jgi:hypothetical protein
LLLPIQFKLLVCLSTFGLKPMAITINMSMSMCRIYSHFFKIHAEMQFPPSILDLPRWPALCLCCESKWNSQRPKNWFHKGCHWIQSNHKGNILVTFAPHVCTFLTQSHNRWKSMDISFFEKMNDGRREKRKNAVHSSHYTLPSKPINIRH